MKKREIQGPLQKLLGQKRNGTFLFVLQLWIPTSSREQTDFVCPHPACSFTVQC